MSAIFRVKLFLSVQIKVQSTNIALAHITINRRNAIFSTRKYLLWMRKCSLEPQTHHCWYCLLLNEIFHVPNCVFYLSERIVGEEDPRTCHLPGFMRTICGPVLRKSNMSLKMLTCPLTSMWSTTSLRHTVQQLIQARSGGGPTITGNRNSAVFLYMFPYIWSEI